MEERRKNRLKHNRGYRAILKIAVAGLIAAVYTVIGVVFAPVTYGPVQIRLGEAFTLLPVFGGKSSIWGVTIGCLLTNIYGAFVGANPAGFLDVFIGTLATLVAALMTYSFRNIRIKNIPFVSALPPVIVNALVIGLELTLVFSKGENMAIFWFNFASVFAGQFVSCVIIGLLMVGIIQRKNLSKYLEL